MDTLSLSMSHFLRTLLCSLSPTLSVLMSYLYLLFIPVPDTSSVLPTTPPRSLQVYTRCTRTDIESLIDSSLMASSSTTSVLPSPANLPISVCKGTRSSRNPHPIYNFMSYHRLSSPYSAFISTFSSVSLPKTVHEALSHSG